MTIKTVPDALADLGNIYRERNKVYGDNYKRHGDVMAALFPNGISLKTPEDHNRFGILTQCVAKLTRYCVGSYENGHVDTLDDLTVYSQMLQELDAEMRVRKGNA